MNVSYKTVTEPTAMKIAVSNVSQGITYTTLIVTNALLIAKNVQAHLDAADVRKGNMGTNVNIHAAARVQTVSAPLSVHHVYQVDMVPRVTYIAHLVVKTYYAIKHMARAQRGVAMGII